MTTSADPATSAEDRALEALIQVVLAAASPAAQEAQALLLRRLALGADIIPSRVPPPANITQVGGYLNLLESLGRQDAAFEVMASALGLAGTALQGGPSPELPFTLVTNDRPLGAAAATAPSAILVRPDFAAGIQAAMGVVHSFGAKLPLWSPPHQAPLGPTSTPLDACGRRLRLLPTAALSDPTTDSLVLARRSGAAGASYEPFARPAPDNAVAVQLPATELVAAVFHNGTPAELDLGSVRLLPLGPLLAEFGWLVEPVAEPPADPGDIGWSTITNISGLLPAVSRLGDELRTVRTAAEIGASVFATRLDWLWDGKDFAPAQA